MSLVRFSDIHKFLSEKGVFLSIFDLVRVVDPVTAQLFEYEGDKLTKTDKSCIEIFGSGERCINCSSARAFHTGEQAVKFEHIGNEVFLVISVPLEHNGQKIVVELIKNITKYTQGELENEALRSEMVNFINNLNASASVDMLTGLKNRTFIVNHIADIVNSRARNDAQFTVALLGFAPPPLYEKYGKNCAELVLASVGGIISAFIRSESDIAARYDDESFLLCFSGAATEACEEVCGRIRGRIEETVINYKGQPIHVTMSIGIASIEETASPDGLIAIAEERMNKAKKQGGGLIVH